MGAGVAFQAPVIMRPPPPPPRAPSGAPSKPLIPTSLPGFPGIPVSQVPRTIIQGIKQQIPTGGGLPVPVRPAVRPRPTTIIDYQIPPSQGPILTGPISGPDQGSTPPPIMPTDSGPGGGGGGGGGSGGGSGIAISGHAQIPWVWVALAAAGLYLVTR
jgi:hypothetical protein